MECSICDRWPTDRKRTPFHREFRPRQDVACFAAHLVTGVIHRPCVLSQILRIRYGFLPKVIPLVLADAGFMNFEPSIIPECRHALSLDTHAIGLDSGLGILPLLNSQSAGNLSQS